MSKLTSAVSAVALAAILSACGGSHPSTAVPLAYAYLVPSTPGTHTGQWSTRVSEHKIAVGDRVPGPNGSVWEVIAVKPTPHDGQHAGIRGWPRVGAKIAHPNRKWGSPVWAGKLVLRQVGRGHLVGAALFGGGPAIDNGRRMSGQVVVYNFHGHVMARQNVRHGGNFDFVLRAGRYRLGFDRHTPLRMGCRPEVATVRSGQTTHQNVSFGCVIP